MMQLTYSYLLTLLLAYASMYAMEDLRIRSFNNETDKASVLNLFTTTWEQAPLPIALKDFNDLDKETIDVLVKQAAPQDAGKDEIIGFIIHRDLESHIAYEFLNVSLADKTPMRATEIFNVVIDSKYRGKGYGELLVNEIERRLIEKRGDYIALISDTARAQRFYKKLKFYTTDLPDCIRMVKPCSDYATTSLENALQSLKK